MVPVAIGISTAQTLNRWTKAEAEGQTDGRSSGEYCFATCSNKGKNSRKQLGHPLQNTTGVASGRAEKRAMKCIVSPEGRWARYCAWPLIRASTLRLHARQSGPECRAICGSHTNQSNLSHASLASMNHSLVTP